jgi:hypothetical protein
LVWRLRLGGSQGEGKRHAEEAQSSCLIVVGVFWIWVSHANVFICQKCGGGGPSVSVSRKLTGGGSLIKGQAFGATMVIELPRGHGGFDVWHIYNPPPLK